jgi:hypothetical protein
MAEECVIAQILREPALLDQTKSLTAEMFSSKLLGGVYGQLKQRHDAGMDVSVAVLTELSGEEMSHITAIIQRQQETVSEKALADCVRTILAEHQASNVSTEDDLLALQNKLRERKGLGV